MKSKPIFRLRETDVYSDEWEFFYHEEHVATIKSQTESTNQWYQFYTITFTDTNVETQHAVGFEESIFRVLYDLEIMTVEENMNV